MQDQRSASIGNELDQLKNKIVNYALVVMASFAFVAQLIVIYRDLSLGNIGLTFYFQHTAILYFIIVAIFRKRLSLRFKLYSIGLAVFLVFLTGIISYGFLASAKIYVALGPVFLSFFINRKKSIIVLGFFLFIYLFIGYLYSTGGLVYPTESTTFFQHYSTNYWVWFMEALIILLTSWGLLYVSTEFEEALTENYKKIKDQNIALEQHQEELEDKIAERTRELTDSNEKLKQTIEKLKDTQVQLIHSEKMASLGILTAGITHEINNPLNFIMGGVQGLESISDHVKPEIKEDFDVLVSAIRSGGEKATSIVNSLDNFSRDNTTEYEECDIVEILEDTLVMLNKKIGDRISVKKNYLASNHIVKGNKAALLQIFLNVLNNAQQAIAENGTITILTKDDDKDLQVMIKDNGVGISEDDQKFIFDPFFTTRPPGEGTGIGLSITYKLVKKMEGNINITSEPGSGTTVVLKFNPHE